MIEIDTSIRSKNFSKRPNHEISAIVLHTGEGTKASDLIELTATNRPPGRRVSAHYYVDRKGKVYELVDPFYQAWHAGASSYMGRTDWNAFSIGIETEHKQGQDWPVVQKEALEELCRHLIATYAIAQNMIAAHRWVAPGRKFDPSDWPDTELIPWIAGLYATPVYSLPGLATPMPCGKGFYDFYTTQGGFNLFGFALTPEQPDIDTLNRECTWMRFERAIFKYVYGEGAHLALLVEAAAKKWLL